MSATLPGFARRTAAHYPVGSEVEVHYDPQNPGESALHPHSRWHYVPWLIAAGMFALAWAGVGLAPAVLAVATYRIFNLWLPLLPAVVGLRHLKRWREAAEAS